MLFNSLRENNHLYIFEGKMLLTVIYNNNCAQAARVRYDQ